MRREGMTVMKTENSSKKQNRDIASYLAKIKIDETLNELSMVKTKKLIRNSKRLSLAYKNEAQLTQIIYELAERVLDKTLGPDAQTLPIDVWSVAEKLGFTISLEDFKETENQYFKEKHSSSPIAQLKMRQDKFGSDGNNICGTIRLADYLSEKSVRFSIAHELGHFVIRQHNPVGSSVVLEACPGLYPLVDADEMLADMFAYALLIPYKLFEKEREIYEKNSMHWPLDYSEWIAYIRDKAQIPEYYAVLACQELRKYDIYQKYIEAEESLDGWFKDSLKSEGEDADTSLDTAKSLYAGAAIGLEQRGYSCTEVYKVLFKGHHVKELPQDVMSVMNRYYLSDEENDSETSDRIEKLPKTLKKVLLQDLHNAGISEKGAISMTKLDCQEVREIWKDLKKESDVFHTICIE